MVLKRRKTRKFSPSKVFLYTVYIIALVRLQPYVSTALWCIANVRLAAYRSEVKKNIVGTIWKKLSNLVFIILYTSLPVLVTLEQIKYTVYVFPDIDAAAFSNRAEIRRLFEGCVYKATVLDIKRVENAFFH